MSQSLPPTTSAAAMAAEAPAGAMPAPLAAAAQASLSQLEAIARELEGRPDALLALLRSLEQLHRTIQDGPFRSSLPADRNALFQLLSEMERSGGWPYIPRLQLRTFLDLLAQGGGDVEPMGAPVQESGGDQSGAGPRLAA